MRFLFVVHKNEEKAEQNSVLFHRLVLKERGLRPNGYFPLMRQPLFSMQGNINRDISGISTKALCEAPAMHDRYVCKESCDSVFTHFFLCM